MPIKVETDIEYHGNEDAVSRSTLWTLHNKTPFHAKFGARKAKREFDIGHAAHIAILEPNLLESRVMNSLMPDRTKRNEWKKAQDEADAKGKILLTSKDYEQALLIRDVADTVPEIKIMRQGEVFIETSAYHTDEEYGIMTKCRPDIYNKDMALACDIKTAADASPRGFQKAVPDWGYHLQAAMYSDVWVKGTDMPVDAFFFVVFEKSEPPMVAVYELSPATVSEGHAIYRNALARYAECLKTDTWPGYGSGVQRIDLKRWDYKLTEYQGDEE